jgi:hypothetical protein
MKLRYPVFRYVAFPRVVWLAVIAASTQDASQLVGVEPNPGIQRGPDQVLDPTPPPPCAEKTLIYSDGFESGTNGWTVSVTGPAGPPTPYNWVQRNVDLPAGLTGTAWFGEDRNIGDCGQVSEAATHSLFSPYIVLPTTVTNPTLAFTHYVETEAGYDGGNVAIAAGSGFYVIPASAFVHNAYNTTLLAFSEGNSNPMAGQPAFSGGNPGNNNSGRSIIDLSSLVTGGQTVRFRFDFGKNACGGVTGWFVDDFDLYHCPVANGAPLINWNLDVLSPTRGTRSLTFSIGPITVPGGAAAIAVKPLDLQHPMPPNAPCCPPPDFSAYESATCTAAGEGNGCIRWVGPVQTFLESVENAGLGAYGGARLRCTPYYTDWASFGTIRVTGAEIVPSSNYEVRTYAASCEGVEASCPDFSPPVTMITRRSGDVASPYDPPSTAPHPDAIDVVATVNKFRNLPGAPSKTIAQTQPNVPDPNNDVNSLDVVNVVDAYRGLAYPYLGPCPCPSAVTCNATPCSSDAQCPGGLCLKTCVGGPNDGLLCRINKNCRLCSGGIYDGRPCDADAGCPGGSCPATGSCGTGFCRDRCARCTP